MPYVFDRYFGMLSSKFWQNKTLEPKKFLLFASLKRIVYQSSSR